MKMLNGMTKCFAALCVLNFGERYDGILKSCSRIRKRTAARASRQHTESNLCKMIALGGVGDTRYPILQIELYAMQERKFDRLATECTTVSTDFSNGEAAHQFPMAFSHRDRLTPLSLGRDQQAGSTAAISPCLENILTSMVSLSCVSGSILMGKAAPAAQIRNGGPGGLSWTCILALGLLRSCRPDQRYQHSETASQSLAP